MRVLFLQDVANVAQAGEVREVAAGYARNHLIPKKLAVLATQQELQRLEKIKRAAEERRQKEGRQLELTGQALEGKEITIRAKAGPTGRLYGAVTSALIAEELSRLTGQEVDRRTIRLPEPIHEAGIFPVEMHLSATVRPTVSVVVEAETAQGMVRPQRRAEQAPEGEEAAPALEPSTPSEATSPQEEPAQEEEGERA